MSVCHLIRNGLVSCVLLSGFVFPALGGPSSATERPNIVVLFTDDQCFASTGVTGAAQVRTPNTDRLAREGILFRRHYDSTAICMGSRASLMTGLYEYRTGCNFGHGPMKPETFERSYPVLLRKAGYRTAFAGKFGFAVTDGASESDGSFDVLPVDWFDAWAGGTGQTSYVTKKNRYLARFADEYPHSTRAYGAFAAEFVRESAAGGQPFCLTVFFKAPHRPFTPDPFFDDVYADTEFTPPENYGRGNGRHLSMQAKLGRQYLTFYNDMQFNRADYARTMRAYHQLIHGVDCAIGMIRNAISEAGVAENTVIILTSDNGFFCGAHGFGGKVLPYEEGSRVPLVIYDPRASAVSDTSDALTAAVDIAPTITEMAGITDAPATDGRSLSGLINGSKTSVRDGVPLFQVWGSPMTFSMSVVTARWKYVYWCCGEGDLEPSEELFDLTADPLELNNAAADPRFGDVLEEMRQLYAGQLKQWKRDAVPYHNYRSFGRLLDPEIPWDTKRSLVTPAMWRQYESLVKQLGVPVAESRDFVRVLEAAEAQAD